MSKKIKLQTYLFISYLVIILIPLIALGTITFYVSSSIVLDQTIEKDISQLNQTSNNIDSIISHMNNISLIAFSSPQLQNMVENEDASRIICPIGDLNIHKFLYNLRSADYYNYTFVFKSYNSGVVYHNNYNYDIKQDYDFSSLEWIIESKALKGKALFVPTYTPDYYERNTQPVISIVREFKNSYTLKPIGFLIVNCKVSLIEDAIGIDNGNHSYIYVYNHDGKIIYPYADAQALYTLNDDQSNIQVINNEKYLVSKHVSDSSGLTYVQVTNYHDIIAKSNLIIKMTIITILFTIILASLVSIPLSKRVSGPMKQLINNMNSINEGKYSKSIVKTHVYEVCELNKRFNKMMRRIEEHIEAEYLVQLRKKDIEYKLLESQISPHFLFNTLESIRMTVAMNGDKNSAQMIYSLASLYRYGIRITSCLVPLKKEIEHITHYVKLQKMRFGDQFNYSLNVEPESEECIVPQLILQPLVENSICHGFSTTKHTGNINLVTKLENNVLTIEVYDNGIGFSDEQLKKFYENKDKAEHEGHIGLLATYERIKHHFKNSNIEIESQKGKFTLITITIKY